jgi:hypothetical protein
MTHEERTALAEQLRWFAANAENLTHHQRREALRHANNLEAINRLKAKKERDRELPR